MEVKKKFNSSDDICHVDLSILDKKNLQPQCPRDLRVLYNFLTVIPECKVIEDPKISLGHKEYKVLFTLVLAQGRYRLKQVNKAI